MMMSSIFGAGQRISEPLTALAVLREPDNAPYGKKHARPKMFIWRGARVDICNRPIIKLARFLT